MGALGGGLGGLRCAVLMEGYAPAVSDRYTSAKVRAGIDGLKGLEPHLNAVHELEHEADGLSRAAMAKLFRAGGDPLDVIKWRDLYTAFEDTIDAAEDAAEAIERMNHKSS